MRQQVIEIRTAYYSRDPKNGIYAKANFKPEDFVGVRKPTKQFKARASSSKN